MFAQGLCADLDRAVDPETARGTEAGDAAAPAEVDDRGSQRQRALGAGPPKADDKADPGVNLHAAEPGRGSGVQPDE